MLYFWLVLLSFEFRSFSKNDLWDVKKIYGKFLTVEEVRNKALLLYLTYHCKLDIFSQNIWAPATERLTLNYISLIICLVVAQGQKYKKLAL